MVIGNSLLVGCGGVLYVRWGWGTVVDGGNCVWMGREGGGGEGLMDRG